MYLSELGRGPARSAPAEFPKFYKSERVGIIKKKLKTGSVQEFQS